MAKTWILLICFMFSFRADADTPVKIRRICQNQTDNYLFFYPTQDTCSSFIHYKIWGRNGTIGPYSVIDSIGNKNADLYIHINANPGIATNWSYFISITDSCGPDYETASDTVYVDKLPPASTFLDSVSVDPLTNVPLLGWSSNQTGDFSYYILYKDSSGLNVVISSFSKDTFLQDNRPSSRPDLGPLKYDISAVDSCDNPKVFNVNPHTTIYLTQKTDTCSKKTGLTWTHYIGWSGIRSYYIYKKTGSNPFILIDSVSSSVLSYQDTITLGLQYQYYIRAFKDASPAISSSSNAVVFSTRFRVDPENTYLSSVDIVQPGEQNIVIKVFNPGEEIKKVELHTGTDLNPNTYLSTINGNQGVYLFTEPLNNINRYYTALAYNECGQSFLSNISRYIFLEAITENNTNKIVWDPYFTWNVGVNYYRIFRGTNDISGAVSYSLLDSVPGTDSNYIDLSPPTAIGENGICYYIEAIQNAGDINGGIESARSIHACITGELKVFIPTAFRPEGYNKTFRPEGSYIDYDHSALDIYDRWGARLISLKGIRNGWNGNDLSGTRCMQGVYLYKIFIKSTNGKENTYSGFVTLLD